MRQMTPLNMTGQVTNYLEYDGASDMCRSAENENIRVFCYDEIHLAGLLATPGVNAVE